MSCARKPSKPFNWFKFLDFSKTNFKWHTICQSAFSTDLFRLYTYIHRHYIYLITWIAIKKILTDLRINYFDRFFFLKCWNVNRWWRQIEMEWNLKHFWLITFRITSNFPFFIHLLFMKCLCGVNSKFKWKRCMIKNSYKLSHFSKFDICISIYSVILDGSLIWIVQIVMCFFCCCRNEQIKKKRANNRKQSKILLFFLYYNWYLSDVRNKWNEKIVILTLG